MGGALAFRDRGVFHTKFSAPGADVGVLLKVCVHTACA